MRDAAEALRLTAQDLQKLGVCDEIVPEPVGGAQRNPGQTIAAVGDVLEKHLSALEKQGSDALRQSRRQKYLNMGSHALVA